MRSVVAALLLAYGLLGAADLAFATIYGPGRIYVPGQIRDGVYIRPHFVSAPAPKPLGAWPAEPGTVEPKPAPLPGLAPSPARGKLDDPS
jgi:hypothetical protein